ncbi:MAG TPA: GPR1/FUN34/YaaH family transporter [Nocardioides sp.]|nr:GPR1/FUN34/YaaH family transporter [Nocardioides sp.]
MSHAESAPVPVPDGNPAVIGVPTFLVGSVALGLVLVGFVPAPAAAASIPIIATATAFGQILSALWASRLGQNAVACIFGVFAGFWSSYAALVLGLTHGWFAIPAASALRVQELFLGSWLAVIVLLTLASLRLPLAFTVLFALVDCALLLVLLGTSQGSTTLTHLGGYAVFSFVVVGAYLFVDAMAQATGGKPLPMGAPVLR